MNLRRMLLIAAAAAAVAFGSVSLGLPGLAEVGCTTAGACARCGDGVCAKSCENATTCPRDCGVTGGTTGSGTTSAR